MSKYGNSFGVAWHFWGVRFCVLWFGVFCISFYFLPSPQLRLATLLELQVLALPPRQYCPESSVLVCPCAFVSGNQESAGCAKVRMSVSKHLAQCELHYCLLQTDSCSVFAWSCLRLGWRTHSRAVLQQYRQHREVYVWSSLLHAVWVPPGTFEYLQCTYLLQ